MSSKRKLISVDESTYRNLKERGQAGDSFNYVIKSALDKIKPSNKEITDQEQELNSTVALEELVVTHCLTDAHNQCSGKYVTVQTLNPKSLIKCRCKCHENKVQ